MSQQSESVWKWLLVTVTAAALSGAGSAFAFRTSPEKIRATVKEAFTDISDQKGMYAKEGRPRLDTLERSLTHQITMASDIQTRLIRLETQLEELKRMATKATR